MSMSEETIAALAARLHEAVGAASSIPMLTAQTPFTIDQAYAIQRAGIALRTLDGETRAGMKMGLTSRAKMEQMGVHAPIYGHLTSSMQLLDGGKLDHQAHCHPRVEPEVAFIMGRDLEGKPSAAQALAAVDGVCAALEVIDSRYQDFKFTLADVVADNASSSKFVLGTTLKRPGEVDVGNLGMVMEVDGQAVQIGSSSAIFEHPVRSLATLVHLLADVGEGLKAGDIVLAGGATAAVAIEPGQRVRLLVDGLGSAGFEVA